MTERALERVSLGDLEEVRKGIVALLPAVAEADEGTQLALAYLTISYGLDPFMGDIWAIPRKVKGQPAGWGLMLGITGRRKVAFRSGQYDGLTFRWLTEDEAALLDVDLGKGFKAIACEVRRRDCSAPFVGLGVVEPGDPSRMNHGQLAKLRAERSALKLAFPVELPSVVEALREVDIEEDVVEEGAIEAAVVRVADEGSGPADEGSGPGAKQDVLDIFGGGS